MVKRSKLVYIIGSVVIGVIALLIVFFVLIASGVIHTRQNKLIFTSATYSSFVYDGRAHTYKSWELAEGELHEGHTAVVTVSGSQTDAGSSTNYLSAAILDEGGADVTEYYDIEYQPGTITVLPREINVISSSDEKVYDGTPLTNAGWNITEGELVASHELKPQFSGSITGVGSAVNYYTAHIFNDNGKEVTSNYSVNYSYGVLNVTPRAVTVTSADGKKTYDGTPLTSEEWDITEGELVDGHILEVGLSGTLTDAGKAKNTFTAVVKDENGTDVTNNYEITKAEGELEVEKRKVTVTSASDKKEYDNTALTNGGWEITEGNFIDGHNCEVTVAGSRIEAGVSPNVFTISVIDGEGNDVSDNYEITSSEGELEVLKREITITSDSATAVYNGEPFSHYGYSITSGSLADGHTENVTISASITEAGSCENTITLVEISDGERDVTENYSVICNNGVLSVNKRTIVLQAGSDFKMYDDTPLVCRDWTYGSELKILAGHQIEVPMNSYRTDVGVGANRIESSQVVITDENDTDVTANYEVITSDGDLYVTPRRITVRSDSASKIYDGTPLTCNGANDYEVVSITQPVEGHSLEVKITGQRTEIGSSFNTIAEVIVYNGEGRDVTFNYEITRQELELVVKADGGSSDNGGGLDESGSIGGSGGDGEGTLAVKVTSQTGDKIYLRYKSFGGYNGKGWDTAEEYAKTLAFNGENYSYNYLTSVALSERQSATATVELFVGNYLLPYYTLLGASGYEIQQSDVTHSGDTTQPYQIVYSTYDFLKYGKINNRLGGYSAEEQIYRDFVYRNYLDVPESTSRALADIAAQFNRGDGLIESIANYVSTAAEYNFKYPQELDMSQDIVVSFLTEFKQGICGHYASAATILYRMAGVPARYVIGYTGTTKAGETVELTSDNAHAWVEVYIDGMGWVQVEVTGGAGGGSGGGSDGNKIDYRNEIMPVREYYKFDNYEHSHSGRLQGLSEFEEKGFTYTAEVIGSGKAVGLYECEIVNFRLFDPDGKDVTEDYNLSFAKGTLQIYVFELTVTTGGASKIYDGKELTAEDIWLEGTPMGSHRVVLLKTTGSRTNVGTSINGYNLKIVGADGNDETYYYKINVSYGNLTVTARELTFIAESAQKPFDRQPLIAENYEMEGELAEGHRAEVTVTGSQTGIGSSTSRVSVKIYDKDGADVTSNYAVTTVTGTLTVTLPQ